MCLLRMSALCAVYHVFVCRHAPDSRAKQGMCSSQSVCIDRAVCSILAAVSAKEPFRSSLITLAITVKLKDAFKISLPGPSQRDDTLIADFTVCALSSALHHPLSGCWQGYVQRQLLAVCWRCPQPAPQSGTHTHRWCSRARHERVPSSSNILPQQGFGCAQVFRASLIRGLVHVVYVVPL